MKTICCAAAGVIAVSIGLANAASGAPLNADAVQFNPQSSNVTNVDYRGYRHCHRSAGDRWCHGRDRGYYGSAPGLHLELGRRHHRGLHDRDRDLRERRLDRDRH